MKWISIKDQLPDNNEQCLMFNTFEEYCYGTLAVLADGKLHYINDEYDGTLITHWMPLPEPPKTEVE